MFDDLPRLVLRDAALTHNIGVMRAFCERSGVLLAPHAKTHLSRELCDRQLAAGAWGLTAATSAQVRTLVGFGAQRVLHANVLVDAAAIDYVAETFLGETSTVEYFCYVDSLAGLDLLERRLEVLAPARKLRVLVELGFAGGRTGARSEADARMLGHRIATSERLELAGVAGYEGLMPPSEGAFPAGTRQLLRGIHKLVTDFAGAGLFPAVPVVTAGGSSYFDLVASQLGPDTFDFPVLTVLRSGCYITHDHGVYERTSPFGAVRGTRAGIASAAAFEPAFELFASVLSAPEPGLVIAGFGRREVPTDDRLPVVLGVGHWDGSGSSAESGGAGGSGDSGETSDSGDSGETSDSGGTGVDTTGWIVTAVNDHHAYLAVPPGTVVAPGTVLRFGISHPCGAFDRWRHIPLVDAGGAIVGEISPAL